MCPDNEFFSVRPLRSFLGVLDYSFCFYLSSAGGGATVDWVEAAKELIEIRAVSVSFNEQTMDVVPTWAANQCCPRRLRSSGFLQIQPTAKAVAIRISTYFLFR
jgi:hypothetical protein